MKWKIVAVLVLILAAATVSLIIYTRNQRAEKNMLEEEQEFKQWNAPTLEQLQSDTKTNGVLAILKDCSNNVIGLSRIVKTDLDYSGSNPTNWWGMATVEFVNKVGGIERKDVWYIFQVIQNSSGGVRSVYPIEDPDRFDCDELKDAKAEYKMGLRYLNGDRVWKDINTAREYFEKSAAQGDQDAAAELAKLPQQ